jgi:hypothetical protein
MLVPAVFGPLAPQSKFQPLLSNFVVKSKVKISLLQAMEAHTVARG